MNRTDQPHPALQFANIGDMQLPSLEYLLNDLSRHGLRLWQDESDIWWWEWHGVSARADEMGSAVAHAIYWYFGLAPDTRLASGQ